MDDDRGRNLSNRPPQPPDPDQQLGVRKRAPAREGGLEAASDRAAALPPPGGGSPVPPGGGSGAPVAQPAPRKDSARAGSLAEKLRLSGRHPVLVFGTSTSGKSTLLVSLFHCLSRNPEISIRLGNPIVDLETPEGKATHQLAVELFERRVVAFEEGVALTSTFLEQPFFVPVDVQPRGSGEAVRLAFMEARGEWFDPSQEETGSIFREMKESIIDVLRNYPDGMSVIHVAPYSISEDTAASTRESDLGLNGAILAYLKHRAAMNQDFHLFLLTKWDQCALPLADSPQFSRVRARDVNEVLERRYPRAWSEYQAMPLHGPVVRRFFMQYAAGDIRDGLVWDPPERHRDTFDRYRRTLWNWLFGNATEEKDADSLTFTRSELFRDVAPRNAARLTFIERITSLVLSR